MKRMEERKAVKKSAVERKGIYREEQQNRRGITKDVRGEEILVMSGEERDDKRGVWKRGEKIQVETAEEWSGER